jgi:hypothetical protein
MDSEQVEPRLHNAAKLFMMKEALYENLECEHSKLCASRALEGGAHRVIIRNRKESDLRACSQC